MKASELIAAARSFMGTRFRHQGRSPITGVDCIGFFIISAHKAGFLPIDFERADYGRAPNDALEERLAFHCEPLEGPEAGCIVAVRWPNDRRAGHIAICTGENLIHCTSEFGCVVEHGYRGAYVRWTKSLWWPRGLERG